MAPLAVLAWEDGMTVTGSDIMPNANVAFLEHLGIAVTIDHSRDNVAGGERPACLLASSAVREENVEVRTARDMGIPVFRRREWWHVACAGRQVVAVAGTHGKTTVASLTAFLLRSKGLTVRSVIGTASQSLPAETPPKGGGRRGGGSPRTSMQLSPDATVQAGDPPSSGARPLLVVEADEYDGAFLGLTPAVAVITNVDLDHVDIYKGQDAMDDAFVQFARRIVPGGLLIMCGDDPGCSRLLARICAETADPQDAGERPFMRFASSQSSPACTRVVLTYGFGDHNDLVVSKPEAVACQRTANLGGDVAGPSATRSLEIETGNRSVKAPLRQRAAFSLCTLAAGALDTQLLGAHNCLNAAAAALAAAAAAALDGDAPGQSSRSDGPHTQSKGPPAGAAPDAGGSGGDDRRSAPTPGISTEPTTSAAGPDRLLNAVRSARRRTPEKRGPGPQETALRALIASRARGCDQPPHERAAASPLHAVLRGSGGVAGLAAALRVACEDVRLFRAPERRMQLLCSARLRRSVSVGVREAAAPEPIVGRAEGRAPQRSRDAGEVSHVVHVYDDYAHHPVEVAAALAAVRQQHPRARVLAVAQPHTPSRLAHFLSDFAAALAAADAIVLLPVFASREGFAAGRAGAGSDEADVGGGGGARVTDATPTVEQECVELQRKLLGAVHAAWASARMDSPAVPALEQRASLPSYAAAPADVTWDWGWEADQVDDDCSQRPPIACVDSLAHGKSLLQRVLAGLQGNGMHVGDCATPLHAQGGQVAEDVWLFLGAGDVTDLAHSVAAFLDDAHLTCFEYH